MMLEVTGLTKAFGATPVLDGASLTVAPGTLVALEGANGTGKTTTLRCCAGLVRPDAGTVHVEGLDVQARRAEALQRLGYLPQNVQFHEALTPRRVLRFYAALRGVSVERAHEALARVELQSAADRPCGALSGGMRQRLGLAVLGLAAVPVLLLDEPGLSLDPTWRAWLMEWLRARTDAGAAVLLSTHLTEVWAPVVDRRLRCANGHIAPVEASASAARS